MGEPLRPLAAAKPLVMRSLLALTPDGARPCTHLCPYLRSLPPSISPSVLTIYSSRYLFYLLSLYSCHYLSFYSSHHFSFFIFHHLSFYFSRSSSLRRACPFFPPFSPFVFSFTLYSCFTLPQSRISSTQCFLTS